MENKRNEGALVTISKSTAAVTAIQCSLISKAALREKFP